MTKKIILSLFCSLFLLNMGFSQEQKVLVFSKTSGWRHKAIEPGIEFFKKVGPSENIEFTFSEDATDMNENNLKQFSAVVFLNTTGEILDERQQAEFERYIQAGGGFMGIHSATDTEYNWPWYNKLVGGYFSSHPGGDVSNIQNGKMIVHDQSHPATKHLPETFEREDEFYSFTSLQTDLIKVLITVDEDSYEQGTMGDWHPMSWYHEFDGGKSFYTNFGHVHSTFESEEPMQKHMIEGLKSVLSDGLDYSKAYSVKAPEENRFVKTVIANKLYEPTELVAMPNGKILLVERRGDVKVWLPETEVFKTTNHIDVFSSFEYGLMGVGIDPFFKYNNLVYLYYTPNTDEHNENILSRFVYDQEKNELDLSSEIRMLHVGVKGNECCHTGGSIDWDSKGNLYLSTGDDTNPHASNGYGPFDFGDDREGWDAARSSANTNDLRGKVLRIKPNRDGTYNIPQGNLYPPGVPNTRPEIYIMGARNPYRISVDKKTDYLYWGDIGPDAGKADSLRGSDGIVEFNEARSSGFYGWPFFVGDNFPYNRYNFQTKESGERFDPLHPVNESPNNTGLKDLPPTQKPLIYYGYGASEKFPEVGSGGANPMAGPVYHSDEYEDGEHKFPSYFDNKLFVYEWIRDWINVVTFDARGNYSSMEPFMPSTKFYHPMDMTFSPDGAMYILEYGPKWFAQNEEASLTKIEYSPNNRPPVVSVSADNPIGAASLTVAFSSEGTLDHDGDDLSYSWDFNGGAEASIEPNPTVIFKKAGVYSVTLEVTDSEGNKSQGSTQIQVGNDIPKIEISVKGNQSFYLGDETIEYTVDVTDLEDGTIGKGINKEDVVVSINYLEGYDKNAVTFGHQRNIAFSNGRRLIADSDCSACHTLAEKSIGPSFKDIAGKYNRNRTNINNLSEKIMSGGGGVWGGVAMAPHPDLELEAAQSMVRYILSVNDEQISTLPATGTYEATAHDGKKDGAYIIQASYQDNGGDVIGSLGGSSTKALRSAKVAATAYDDTEGTMKFDVPQIGEIVVAMTGTWIKYNGIDFTGISSIQVSAFSAAGQTVGGSAEFRLGSISGTLIGTALVEGGNMAPITVELENLPDEPTDLYVVFTNPDADGKPLFGLLSVEFKK